MAGPFRCHDVGFGKFKTERRGGYGSGVPGGPFAECRNVAGLPCSMFLVRGGITLLLQLAKQDVLLVGNSCIDNGCRLV